MGAFFIVVAWNERVLDWATFLRAVIGAWWIYAAVRNLFPAGYFRSAYQGTDLSGRRFAADVNEDGFEAMADTCSGHVQWPGVRVKGENKTVFLLRCYGTLFMFGKKYLSIEQQQQLHKFGGLAAPEA